VKPLSIPPLEIPITEFASQGNALLGIKGSGKSYGATYLAERLMDAEIPIIAFDPIGVWRNLKVPGKGKAYPVVVAHPENGDLPLTPHSAPEIVRAAMRENISLVLDLYSMRLSKADWRNIVEQSIRVLLYENKGLRHLFIEEASEFCPQRVQPDQGRVYAEIEKLARMGGNASLGYTLINQRAEEVNKAVLEICDCLILHRQKGKNSLTSLGKWLDFSDPSLSKKIIQTLPTLDPGQCWIWSQGQDIPALCRFPTKNTFHPDRKHPNAQAITKAVDVGSFVAQLSNSLEKLLAETKENDPAELKRRIRELEKVGKSVETKTVEIPAFTKEESELMQAVRTEFWDLAARFDTANGRMTAVVNAIDRATNAVKNRPGLLPLPKLRMQIMERRPSASPSENASSVAIRGGMQRMMIALAQRPGLSKRQLGIRAGLSSRSGTFGTYLGTLRSNGWIEGDSENLELTKEGHICLGDYQPLPEGKDLYDYWMSELGNSGAARMLAALYEAYPRKLTKEELGEAAQISHTSGTFGTYLGTLRSLELIEGSKELLASKELQ
jgi:uncharacterized protein